MANSTTEEDYWSVFYVSAHTDYPELYVDSEPDSACSIDNLAPEAPTNLSAQSDFLFATLSWTNIQDTDFNYYAIYRNNESGFEPVNPVGYSTDPSFNDYSIVIGDNYYIVSAFDFAGNESVFSSEYHFNYAGPEVDPPTNIGIEVINNNLIITWTASSTPGVTYVVYESEFPDGEYRDVTAEGTLNGNSWQKNITTEAKRFYQIRSRLSLRESNE